jgi:uncharacterized membrane protein
MRPLHLQRYLITGLLTIIPLWITFLVFRFIVSLLAQFGAPVIGALFAGLSRLFPNTTWFTHPWLISAIGFVATLVTFYVVGLVANRMVGK